MSTVSQVPLSLAGIPSPRSSRTFDPSTAHDPMPDFAEPILSPAGIPDELSAAGQRYALAKMNSYAAAHLEADTDDLLCEVDHLRDELAARDWTPEQFAAQVAADAPGVLFSFEAIQHVGSDALGVKVTSKFGGWAKFPGAPVRHLSGTSWRELAERIVAEHKARKGMGRVPVIEAAAV